MQTRFRHYTGARAISFLLALALLAATPARADTTVAEYIKLEQAQQADLLGKLVQSLADDLQANNREKQAECLAALYTVQSEARVPSSPGVTDFFHSVEVAQQGDPKRITVEEIIAKQLIQYCGVRPAQKK